MTFKNLRLIFGNFCEIFGSLRVIIGNFRDTLDHLRTLRISEIFAAICTSVELFVLVLRLNCTAVSQLESSIFHAYYKLVNCMFTSAYPPLCSCKATPTCSS